MANSMYCALGALLIATLACSSVAQIPNRNVFGKTVQGYPNPRPSFPVPRPQFPQRPAYPPVGPPVRPSGYPPVRPSGYPPVHPSGYPPVRPSGYPPVYPPVGPPVYPPVYPPIYPPVYPPPVVVPPPSCDPCEVADTGNQNQLELIEEIIELKEDIRTAAEACNEERPLSLASITEGEFTENAGDISTATCPQGNIVVGCMCSLPSGSDCRAFFVSGNNRRCEIVAQNHQPNQAVALCSTNVDGLFEFVQSQVSTTPSVSCPEGTTPVDCWLQKVATSTLIFSTDIDSNTGECTPRGSCSSGDNCRLRLLCQRVAEDA